jgi:hypothetical protein
MADTMDDAGTPGLSSEWEQTCKENAALCRQAADALVLRRFDQLVDRWRNEAHATDLRSAPKEVEAFLQGRVLALLACADQVIAALSD